MLSRSTVSAWFAVCLALVASTGWGLVEPGYGSTSVAPKNSRFRIFPSHPPAPDFDMILPDGSTLRLSDLRGYVLILNFWRSDCRYCPLEKGHIRMMLKALKDPNVKVVYVDFWDPPDWVRRYAGRHRADYYIFGMRSDSRPFTVKNVVRGRPLGYYVLNEKREAVYEIKGFPTSYVIDKRGRVVAAHMGMAEWSRPSIRKWIGRLAEQPAPAQPK
jgi:peroxiredoxin